MILISRTKLAHRSLLGSMVLAIALVSPIWADDDNERKAQNQDQIDCGDPNNVNHSECSDLLPPQTVVEESPPQTSQPAAPPTPTGPPPVVTIGSPFDVLLTLPDAGKEATRVKLDEGSDSKGQWAHARYERRAESGSVESLGPIVIDHTVYVAPNAEMAKQIFNTEKDRNAQFPEKAPSDKRTGSFPWNLQNFVEQTAALSACSDCASNEQLYLHHRIVQQNRNGVSVLYLYGRDKRGSEEITTQKASEFWARMIADRM